MTLKKVILNKDENTGTMVTTIKVNIQTLVIRASLRFYTSFYFTMKVNLWFESNVVT